MSPINLDWNAIRPLNGSSSAGFEELCAQLARAESPRGSRFERKGSPDAGVECYSVLTDGSEWGWQAKYFDNLAETQWKQLDSSISTALKKHPYLVRYFVCAPLDRSDARLKGRRSAMEQWTQRVKKWTTLAGKLGMTVEFVWWGSHELLERLSSGEHAGRLRFWFDIRAFDQGWMSNRLNEALQTAGPRYTPEIHVELPIAMEFEAFGRTNAFFNQVKNCARQIRKKLQHFQYAIRTIEDQSSVTSAQAVVASLTQLLSTFSQVSTQPTGELALEQVGEQIETGQTAIKKLDQELLQLEEEYEARPLSQGSSTGPNPYQRNPFREYRHSLSPLSNELRKSYAILSHGNEVAEASLLILKGPAGTGKTHLLCDVARNRLAAGLPTILLMGQRFIDLNSPWTQALQQLDLTMISAEEFVGAIEAAVQAANCRCLIIIDAINEGSGRLIWPNNLAAFLTLIEKSPWVGTVLSVRSSYEEIVIPEDIRNRAVHITHTGFAEHEYDATKTFFSHFNLELPSTPLMAPEFRNPLFLKTLCQGLQQQGTHRLPRGFHGITAIFDLYLNAINNRLAFRLDYNPKDDLVSQALEGVLGAIIEEDKRWLTIHNAEKITNTFLPGRDFERSLYRGLVSEGILIEEVLQHHSVPNQEIVFVGYERLADHLIAKILLDNHLNSGNPEEAFLTGGPLAFISDEKKYISPGLVEAFCTQLPERVQRELPSILPDIKKRWMTGDAFCQSIIWRSYTAFSDETIKVLNELIRNRHESYATLDAILTVATLPEHPLNGNFLDRHLRKLSMPDRDGVPSIS